MRRDDRGHTRRPPRPSRRRRSRPRSSARGRTCARPRSTSTSARPDPKSESFVFTDCHGGNSQQGPMIIDRAGRLVWFNPVSDHGTTRQRVFNVRVQQLPGRAGAHLVAGLDRRRPRPGPLRDRRSELSPDRARPGRQRLQGRPARVPPHRPGHGAADLLRPGDRRDSRPHRDRDAARRRTCTGSPRRSTSPPARCCWSGAATSTSRSRPPSTCRRRRTRAIPGTTSTSTRSPSTPTTTT